LYKKQERGMKTGFPTVTFLSRQWTLVISVNWKLHFMKIFGISAKLQPWLVTLNGSKKWLVP